MELMQRLGGEHLVECVEADENHQGDYPDEQGAGIAELGPRLDHLRQPELWTLSRMEGHEESAERAAGDHRDRGPQEVATEADAEDANCQGGELSIPRKPNGPELPDL